MARLIALTSVTAEPARDPTLNYDPLQPDQLTITLRSGDVIETNCAYPLGAPQNPMSPDQLAAKFQAITTLPRTRFEHLLQWPDAPDAARFFQEIPR